MLWRWMVRSMDWTKLTKPTWKAPYTYLWYVDHFILRPVALSYKAHMERLVSETVFPPTSGVGWPD